MPSPLHAVTGALGYTGRVITERLLVRGIRVRTLTNSPGRPNPFGDALDIRPLEFGDDVNLVESLRGVEVLYNTYWVRFNHRLFSFDEAVANTKRLFAAASAAGVRRVVHVSILNPDRDPTLAYYRGKTELERSLLASGLSHAIVRPEVLFGRGDILVNNIAWMLRHMPVFGVFGDGQYRLRPLHVDDMAELCVEQGVAVGNAVVDAVGPETFTFRELVERLREILGLRTPIVRVPPWVGLAATRLLGPVLRDVVLTREEVLGLMRDLLYSAGESRGTIRVSDWACENRETLGRKYASEVGRRVRRDVEYAKC